MTESDNTAEIELTPRPTKRSSAWLWMILLLLCALAGGGFYLWQFFNTTFAQHQEQISALQNNISQLQASVSANSQKITATETQTQTVQDMAQQALDLGNRRQSGWMLAEADYLMRIASQRLQISRDINGAIAALQGADQGLHESADLSLFPVRQQLAKELTALKSLQQVDIDGLVLKLDQMSDLVINLPFKSVDQDIKQQLPDSAEPETTGEGISDKIIGTIKAIGDIKIHQRGVSPAITHQQHLRNEHLFLTHMASARLAALRFDTKQFLYDINMAQQTLNTDYDVTDNRVAQMLKELAGFSTLDLSPVLPDISTSWRMLQTARNKVAEKQK